MFALQLAAYARQELYLREIPQVLLVLAANDERFKDDSPESLVRAWAPAIIRRMDETATALAVHIPPFDEQLCEDFAPGERSVSVGWLR